MISFSKNIGKLIQEAGEIFTTASAASIWKISTQEAAKILSRWTHQKRLMRIRRGLYSVIPLDAPTSTQTLDDAWLIVPDLFSPGYIGGWSAAEHWHLTEQIFQDICVFTERPVSRKKQKIHKISFFSTHIPPRLNFGTKTIWKKNKKIKISDPHKTIIDMLYNPQTGGGIQHVIDCFKEYCHSSYNQPEQLALYAQQYKTAAVFKRLGFLAENFLGETHLLTQLCKANITKGLIYLEPALKTSNIIINRWQLSIPTHLQIEEKL